MVKAPPKPKRGKPRIDPTGTVSKGQTNLTPTMRTHLIDNYGTVSAGLRALVEADMRKPR